MNIVVVGSKEQADLIREKVKGDHKILFAGFLSESHLEKAEVVFDFNFDESTEYLEKYVDYPNMSVFLNAVTFNLAEQVIYQSKIECNLFGFNGHPTFIERDILEVSLYNKEDSDLLESLMKSLTLEFQLVDDRVGMVTPRIIAMIINEAFYTVMEGTATKDDIDVGMKLGTNYPMGPFEWASNWGITNVYEVLEALYDDTKDERYKICPLLKKEYLENLV
jgi:3-hydroxybutyryl-CoA dehydrogenase